MEDALLNELLATSKDQLRLLQIIANRLVDGRPGFDEKPEPVSGKSTDMFDEEKVKWSLAGKKAWATRRANMAKALEAESKAAGSVEKQDSPVETPTMGGAII